MKCHWCAMGWCFLLANEDSKADRTVITPNITPGITLSVKGNVRTCKLSDMLYSNRGGSF